MVVWFLVFWLDLTTIRQCRTDEGETTKKTIQPTKPPNNQTTLPGGGSLRVLHIVNLQKVRNPSSRVVVSLHRESQELRFYHSRPPFC